MFGKKARERRKARREKRRKRNAAAAAKQSKTLSAITSPPEKVSDGVTTQSTPVGESNTSSNDEFISIREIYNQDEEQVQKQRVGNFSEIAQIRLYGEYPQNFVDIPRYDLSKVNVLLDQDIEFDFILCLKEGADSEPQLYASARFFQTLMKEYRVDGSPFAVNDIIEEKNIVVVDIKPIKEKVEELRAKELSINLNRNEISGQVEVRKNLFVYSNYQVGSGGVLEANPTYDINELIKYITWVVSKPAANYDDRLIPTNELGDYDGYTKEEKEADTNTDSPSNEKDTQTDDNGNPKDPNPKTFLPIGRRGVQPGETVLFNGKYWEWDAVNEEWVIDLSNNGQNPNDGSTPGQGNPPTDGDGSNGNTGGSPGTGTGRPTYMD
jgi:hypothetical protein|tara:strand:+ start:2647 stop:3789 length:1143 start_codon:yes stop_codon:yes gene_type:complete